jgi:hypothetical protein
MKLHELLSGAFTSLIMAGRLRPSRAGVADGHHSLVMYDREHPIEITGAVREIQMRPPRLRSSCSKSGQWRGAPIWNLEGDGRLGRLIEPRRRRIQFGDLVYRVGIRKRRERKADETTRPTRLLPSQHTINSPLHFPP